MEEKIVRVPDSTPGLLKSSVRLQRLSAISRNMGKRTNLSSEIQVCFACDSTGSMYEIFSQAISSIREILQGIEKVKPEASFIAYKNHGDEILFDGEKAFVASPWTHDFEQTRELLGKIQSNGGGDGLTVLEDVFQYLVSCGEWKKDAKKVLVIIGDMPPHGVLDSVNKCPHKIDYRKEVASLKKLGVTVYSVFCPSRHFASSSEERKSKIRNFYQWIATETGGKCLSLEETHEIVAMLTAVCIKESGQAKSLEEIRAMLSRIANPALAERIMKMLQ